MRVLSDIGEMPSIDNSSAFIANGSQRLDIAPEAIILILAN